MNRGPLRSWASIKEVLVCSNVNPDEVLRLTPATARETGERLIYLADLSEGKTLARESDDAAT